MPATELTGAGNVTTGNSGGTGVSSLACAKPANVADGDLLIARVTIQGTYTSGDTCTETTSAWTAMGPAQVSTYRGTFMFYLAVPSAAALTATTWTWSQTFGSGRMLVMISRVTGANLSSPVDVTGTRATEGTSGVTIPSITPVGTSDLLVGVIHSVNTAAEGNAVFGTDPSVLKSISRIDSVTSGSASNDTLLAIGAQYSGNAATGTQAFTVSPALAAVDGFAVGLAPAVAATGSITLSATGGGSAAAGSSTGSLSLAGAAAASGPGTTASAALTLTATSAVMAAAGGTGSITLSASAFTRAQTSGTAALSLSASLATPTPLQQWLAAHNPFYIAHRGGDADWPQDSAYAYAQATAWNSQIALEVSVWPTSDGYWMLSDTSTTGAVYATNYTIASTPRATLAALRSTVGNYPPMFLDTDVLATYRNRILFLDNKGATNVSSLLTLLGTYGFGPGNVVAKSYGGGSPNAWITGAITAGYQTWGYFYDTDVTSGALASYQSYYSILGMDVSTGTSSDWSTVIGYGKRVGGFIIATAANAATAQGYGATGLMVSGVMEVVPNDSASLTGSLTLSAGGAATPSAGGSAALTLSVAGTSAARAGASATILFTATGATGGGMATGAAALTLTASGTARTPAAGTASLIITAAGSSTTPTGGTAAIVLTAVGAVNSTLASGTAAIVLAAMASVLANAGGSATITLTATGTGHPTAPYSSITVTITFAAQTGPYTVVLEPQP